MFFRKHLNLNKREKGQTIIEVLVALGASVAIITAVTIAVTSALSNSLYNKNQNLATQYAQQGMELMRQMRNADWITFSALGGNPAVQYCLGSDGKLIAKVSGQGCKTSTNSPPDNLPPFAREVDIDNASSVCVSSILKVKVIVSWTDGKCQDDANGNKTYCHNVSLSSCFSNVINTVPTP